MAPGQEGLDDPALRRATSRDQWHVGSAVEIFSNTDRRWNIGWVVQEDPMGNLFHVLFNDGESSHLKCKQVRRDDQQLEPVGTNLRKLPMYFELALDGALVQRTTNRRCSTFEEAWRVHYEVYLRSHVVLGEVHVPAAQPGGLTVRGHVQVPPGTLQQLSAQPVPTQTAVLGAAGCGGGFSMPPGGAEVSNATNGAGGSLCAQVVPGAAFEPPTAEKIARLQQSVEEHERHTEEAMQQNEELRAELAVVRKELEDTKAERDQAIRRYREAKAEIERLQASVAVASSADREVEAPQVGGAAAATGTGQGGHEEPPRTGGRSQRHQQQTSTSAERPVEVMVRVPRALTPEEVLEVSREETQRRMVPPARSLQNLAQGVVRMPSAPAHSASGASAASTHRMALASHRASVAYVSTTQQQQQQQQQQQPQPQPQPQQQPQPPAGGPQHMQQPQLQHLQKPLQQPPQQLQQHQPHLQVVPGVHQAMVGLPYRR